MFIYGLRIDHPIKVQFYVIGIYALLFFGYTLAIDEDIYDRSSRLIIIGGYVLFVVSVIYSTFLLSKIDDIGAIFDKITKNPIDKTYKKFCFAFMILAFIYPLIKYFTAYTFSDALVFGALCVIGFPLSIDAVALCWKKGA